LISILIVLSITRYGESDSQNMEELFHDEIHAIVKVLFVLSNILLFNENEIHLLSYAHEDFRQSRHEYYIQGPR